MKNRIIGYFIRFLKKFIDNNQNHSKNKIQVNFNDHIGEEIQMYGFYESFYLINTIPYFNDLVLSNTMLDIGANIGNHSVFFSNYFNKIYSFEPQKETFKLLKINTDRISNIETFNYGISTSSLTEKIYVNSKNRGMISKIREDDFYFKESIQFRPYNKKTKDKISYIKIDVEGNEIDVLNSLKNILIKDKPIISFEFNDPFVKKNIVGTLNNYGYDDFYVFNRDFENSFLSKLIPNKSNRLKKTFIDESKNFGIVFTFSNNSYFKLNGI